MINVGSIVRFKIRDISGRVFECEGIVYGRVTDHGGPKYMIKSWQVIDAPVIGIRNVEEK